MRQVFPLHPKLGRMWSKKGKGTPLTFIKGYADIANRSTTSLEDKTQYLRIIREESRHLTQLMEDLMNLAQLEENGFKVEKHQVLIQELINEVVSKVSGVFSEKRINQGEQMMLNNKMFY